MANEIDRGAKVLRWYLNSISEMSVRENRRLFRLIEDEYRERMKDPGYFETFSRFLNRRKSEREKRDFCFYAIKSIVKQVDLKAQLREKFPGDYE